jgi:hypothetical protein
MAYFGLSTRISARFGTEPLGNDIEQMLLWKVRPVKATQSRSNLSSIECLLFYARELSLDF